MPSSRGNDSAPEPAGDGASRIEARAIHHAQRGDGDAIQFLYARYADALFDHVQAVVTEPAEAEAVVHNVFARLHTSIRLYRNNTVSFPEWILRIARETALEHLREPD